MAEAGRFSNHIYNTREEVELALEGIRDIAEHGLSS